MRIMSVTPINKVSGIKELVYYYKIAEQMRVNILLFPSSFLPFYKNSGAFYNEQNIMDLPYKLFGDGSVKVVTGINEQQGNKLYKTVIVFNSKEVLYRRRKVDLEPHYIEKGYSAGDGGDQQFVINGVRTNILECYEVLFQKNWEGNPKLLLGSIGFGMKAVTKNYNCDYFDQWLNQLKAHCLYNNCYAVMSSNGQHKDYMTVAINNSGEVEALSKVHGFFCIDVDLEAFDVRKQPYLQYMVDNES
jgi:predicted amidohydrolase